MAIYLLTRGPEDWGGDENNGFVISAPNEDKARSTANESASDEGHIWDDCDRVKCEIINKHTPTGIILRSFTAG